MNEKEQPDEKLDQIEQGRNPGIFAEIWDYARAHKKLWIIPLMILLLLAGLLIILGGSSAAPFIYRLF